MQTLTAIMNNTNGVVYGYARNILAAKGEIVYKEPYIFPNDGLKSSKIRHRIIGVKHESNNLKVYPNPARNYVIIEYSLNAEPENAVMLFFDALGRKIRKISINANHDWLILPVSDLPTGNYLITLFIKDKIQQSTKLIVLK